jgi:hypothetical protein
MSYRLLFSRCVLPTALLVAASCQDATAPESRTADELRLLHVTADAPQLATTQLSFYAVKGRASTADIWYHALPGQSDSLKFLEFRLGAGSLDRRPDGSVIASGDSVLITITVTDPSHMLVDYQPSGLRFSPNDPPTMRMFWGACGDDLNYDGDVNAYDLAIAQQLSIWRQEGAGQPWFKMASVVAPTLKEVDTQLPGFTGYAISY